jgi:hypothetical protein
LSVRKSRERDELEREWECKNEWLSWWVLCLGHLTSWTGVHFGGARWSLKVTFHISTRDDSIGCSIVMTDYLMVSIYYWQGLNFVKACRWIGKWSGGAGRPSVNSTVSRLNAECSAIQFLVFRFRMQRCLWCWCL